METYSKDWDSVVSKIEERWGSQFHPKKITEFHQQLANMLVRELPQFEKEVVIRALDQTYKQVRVTVDWHRFICIFLSSLPGWWVKLTNNPGFGASTMLLLTDGTVMCQEEGGLNWKKLTPNAHGDYINGTW